VTFACVVHSSLWMTTTPVRNASPHHREKLSPNNRVVLSAGSRFRQREREREKEKRGRAEGIEDEERLIEETEGVCGADVEMRS
jgi:hypothetical protein